MAVNGLSLGGHETILSFPFILSRRRLRTTRRAYASCTITPVCLYCNLHQLYNDNNDDNNDNNDDESLTEV